ncbi:uncharacterized protein LOC127852590 [Dreissena polymorpha]|uniref:uncharacterized protein LOC127852590 n=1 Tax=Dreissena polymorpha TaxID=45954 RepID=UPI00226411F9|nr:uncharacterized protein LOC127852590 [Dreissena polymorpha]
MTKFPILLPIKHHIIRLIVRDAHITHLHSGVNATVAHIRQKYWIPPIRQFVQAVVRKCVTCRRVVGRAFRVPEPPPLPKMSVEDTPPFTVTGVDFTGALYVKQTNGNLNDPAPITPSQLLFGRRVTTLPYDDVTVDTGSTVAAADHAEFNRMARRREMLIQQFYRRWNTEYLTSLREHHRMSGSNTQTIKIGDVVQIDDDGPRCRWKLAVVVDVITGRGGHVRAAKVRTSNGLYTMRPIAKLYPLEVISANGN